MFTTLGATFFTTGAKLLPLCAVRSIGWSETLTLGGVAESLATTATPSHPATASRPRMAVSFPLLGEKYRFMLLMPLKELRTVKRYFSQSSGKLTAILGLLAVAGWLGVAVVAKDSATPPR